MKSSWKIIHSLVWYEPPSLRAGMSPSRHRLSTVSMVTERISATCVAERSSPSTIACWICIRSALVATTRFHLRTKWDRAFGDERLVVSAADDDRAVEPAHVGATASAALGTREAVALRVGERPRD